MGKGVQIAIFTMAIATCGLCACGNKNGYSNIEENNKINEGNNADDNIVVEDDMDIDGDFHIKVNISSEGSIDFSENLDDEKAVDEVDDTEDEDSTENNRTEQYTDLVSVDKHFRNSKIGDKREDVTKAESEALFTDFDLKEDGGTVVAAKNVITTAGNADIIYIFKDDVLIQGMITFDEDTKERILTKYSELQRGFIERFGEPKENAENYGEDGAYVSIWEVDGIEFGLTTLVGKDKEMALCIMALE